MRISLLIGIFAFFLVAGTVFPALSQSEPFANNVVINEVEINPPGDDSKAISEWVELYNPTDTEIDISGWSVGSTTVLKKTFTIPEGTTIKPGGFLTYSYVSVWFTDVSELVQLQDQNGIVIDETPKITDVKNDFTSWQRTYDGFDADSANDWKFETSTAGSTNGKFTLEEEALKTSLSASIDKTSYLFDETATISGSVSERVFTEKPVFVPAEIKINISGPNGYGKSITLYPDLFLKFKTELDLVKVLGISEGIYDITVEYAGAIEALQFSVGEELIEIQEKEAATLEISTDEQNYIPGQTATITAFSSEIIPFEGLKFKVLDPNKKQIAGGNLYPDLTNNRASVRGGNLNANPEAQFSTTVFLTTVGPVYGIYEVIGEYSTHSALATFELSEDKKANELISLSTDKGIYGLGETVIISGRLNNLWIFAFDLEIIQTSNLALGVLDYEGGGRNLKILDTVRLEGDSTFRYEFKIPIGTEALGDYRATVSKEVGTASTFFKVVENPDEYVEVSSKDFLVITDKTLYESGDPIVISGKVNQIRSSTFQTPTVDITIKRADGTGIFTQAGKPSSNEPDVILYSLTAVPDIFGNYQVRDKLANAIYDEGDYVVKASYADGTFTDTTQFSIFDPLNVEHMIISLDKQVYGLGEEVHLTGIIPTGGAGKAGLGITVTKPDGDTDKFGTTIDGGRFAWSWTIPAFEKSSQQTGDGRSQLTTVNTNYGIYTISASQSDNPPVSVFFKVSPNPDEDSLAVEPLTVTTDKPIYNAADKLTVLGTAMTRTQGTEGLVVPDRVSISVRSPTHQLIYESTVYFDSGGNFHSIFEMPVTVFKDGTYKVTATYLNHRAENFFQVSNIFTQEESDTLSLLISTDKEEYNPGDVAHISARPTKNIFVEKIDVGIPTEEQTKINCGSFVCGKGVPITTLRPDPTGTFSHDFAIPNDSSSIGTYIITFDAEFGTFTKPLTVVEKVVEESAEAKQKFGERIIEKFNRITESFVSIAVNEKVVDEKEVFPRTIQGSLFTPIRGEEPNVNIKVSAEDGACIIGSEDDCMITKSTRGPGTIYQSVTIDGMDYKIRYSGPDVRLEKFTILPESSEETLPDSTWGVEITKDGDQSSRLYYKVTYVTLE